MLGPQRRGGRWRRGGRAAITRAPLALASPARLPCPPLPRPQAEAMLGQLKLAPDACAQQLVRALRTSPDLQSRALSAVLLRKVRAQAAALLPPPVACCAGRGCGG